MKDESKEFELLLRKISQSEECIIEVKIVDENNIDDFKHYFEDTFIPKSNMYFTTLFYNGQRYGIRTNLLKLPSSYVFYSYEMYNNIKE